MKRKIFVCLLILSYILHFSPLEGFRGGERGGGGMARMDRQGGWRRGHGNWPGNRDRDRKRRSKWRSKRVRRGGRAGWYGGPYWGGYGWPYYWDYGPYGGAGYGGPGFGLGFYI